MVSNCTFTSSSVMPSDSSVCAATKSASWVQTAFAYWSSHPGAAAPRPLRRSAIPLRTIAEDGDDTGELLRQSRGGYIRIPEISRYPAAPGYIWGPPVRKVFAGTGDGVSLAAALHAPDPEEAFATICEGCGVSDADAAKVEIVIYLRSLGRWQEPTRRVVSTVHEITGVRDGKPTTRLLFAWDEATDRFVKQRR